MKIYDNYYDDFYNKKDFIHFKQDRTYVQLLCSFLPDPTNSSVLDVGCGRGYWSKLFHECGVGEVVGIDISYVGLNIARQESPAVKFILANANHLQFEDKTFDMVFCQGLSEFNTYDLSKTRNVVEELLRCLKDNGLFILAVSTNLSGKKRNGWIHHKPNRVVSYLASLGCQIEATYFIDRAVFLRLLGRHSVNSLFSKYLLPIICHITQLPACLVCITRKKR
jgi:ubiquinone/menaquinone biosynthesis C-methylase UbiE